MSITGVDLYSAAGTSASLSAAKAKSEENSTLSMDDFFTLLSAQMQNQTMYDSVDTADYMAQLVQYTTLAQLQELTSSSATSYAVSLIGKNVEVLGTSADGEKTYLTGTVEQVAFEDGTPYVLVGGVYYEASEIQAVGPAEVGSNEVENSETDLAAADVNEVDTGEQ